MISRVFSFIVVLLAHLASIRSAQEFSQCNQTTGEWNYPENRAIHSINYVGRGYNIYKGNPNSRYHSMGMANPILQISYNNSEPLNEMSSDMRLRVPQGLRFSAEKSCSTQYMFRSILSHESYRNNLNSRVSVEGNNVPLIGSFSLSYDYQRIAQLIEGQKSIVLESEAECAMGRLDVVETISDQPVLKDMYVQELLYLYESGDSANNYYRFFDDWGTHVITGTTLGSISGTYYILDLDQARTMQQNGVNLEVTASLYTYNVESLSQQTRTDFEKALQGSYQYWSGNKFNDNIDKWTLKTTSDSVLKLSLLNHTTVIDRFTKRDSKGLNTTVISQVTKYLTKYFNSYCSSWLVDQNLLSSCEDPQVEIKDFSFLKLKPNTTIEKWAVQEQLLHITNMQSSLSWVSNSNSNFTQKVYQPNKNEFNFQIIWVGPKTFSLKSAETQLCLTAVSVFDESREGRVFRYDFLKCEYDFTQLFEFTEYQLPQYQLYQITIIFNKLPVVYSASSQFFTTTNDCLKSFSSQSKILNSTQPDWKYLFRIFAID